MGKAGVKAEKEETGVPKEEVYEVEVGWSRNKALAILSAVTIALAIMSEILTGAIEPAAESLGLTPLFAGVFLLAVVGNAAEHDQRHPVRPPGQDGPGDRHHGRGQHPGRPPGRARPGLRRLLYWART